MTGSRKTRDAVAAKLRRAQGRSDEKYPTGMPPKRAAAQNRRVADRIEKREGK